MRILVAGIGNMFLGDDAFGVEVVRALQYAGLPSVVEVRDFGIRGFDLAFALLSDYDVFILVDAVPRGETPGTLYLIAPEADLAAPSTVPDAHNLHPARVLEMAKVMGGCSGRVLLLGCEPVPLTELEEIEGRMGLSAQVAAAVPEAVRRVVSLVHSLESEAALLKEEGSYA